MNLDNCQIAEFIDCKYSVNGQDCAVGEFNNSYIPRFNYMIVRHDHAIRTHEETCAQRYGLVIGRRDDSYDCTVRSFGYRRDVLSRWHRLRGNDPSSDKNQRKKFPRKTIDHFMSFACK